MPTTKRRAKPKKVKEPNFVVYCGDAWRMFTHGTKWKLSPLTHKLNEFLRRIEFVPGLVLRREDGTLVKPVLQLQFVPVDIPEEPNG